jgi:hypothetical protein
MLAFEVVVLDDLEGGGASITGTFGRCMDSRILRKLEGTEISHAAK